MRILALNFVVTPTFGPLTLHDVSVDVAVNCKAVEGVTLQPFMVCGSQF